MPLARRSLRYRAQRSRAARGPRAARLCTWQVSVSSRPLPVLAALTGLLTDEQVQVSMSQREIGEQGGRMSVVPMENHARALLYRPWRGEYIAHTFHQNLQL